MATDKAKTPVDASHAAGASTEDNSDRYLWACPFHKLEPIFFEACSHNKFYHVKDVIQHLQAEHRQPPVHCEDCGKVFQGPTAHKDLEEHPQEESDSDCGSLRGFDHPPIMSPSKLGKILRAFQEAEQQQQEKMLLQQQQQQQQQKGNTSNNDDSRTSDNDDDDETDWEWDLWQQIWDILFSKIDMRYRWHPRSLDPFLPVLSADQICHVDDVMEHLMSTYDEADSALLKGFLDKVTIRLLQEMNSQKAEGGAASPPTS